ncbi:hypothetical protein SAMN05444006_10885 [Allgaiera indica]|uniref:Photosystem II phosphoprotein n=1 Tax=Allgaiera indica TaxID=765699 RepID=A0A1H2XMQ7_9RHOB|nr:hypothetical protein SAMN05444006_10885 [Allgaiera indica]
MNETPAMTGGGTLVPRKSPVPQTGWGLLTRGTG